MNVSSRFNHWLFQGHFSPRSKQKSYLSLEKTEKFMHEPQKSSFLTSGHSQNRFNPLYFKALIERKF